MTAWIASRSATVACLTRSGYGAAGHHPLHGLSGDSSDEVVVAVVMEHRHAFPLRDGGNEQAGEPDCPDLPAAPQRALGVQRPPPVLILGGQPFIPGVAVGAQFAELLATP